MKKALVFGFSAFILNSVIFPSALRAVSFFSLYSEEELLTKSGRLDALQTTIAVPDDANPIGLLKWAGNPAGLVEDETVSRITPVLGAAAFDWNSSDNPSFQWDDRFSGLLGVWRVNNQAFRADTQLRTLEYDSGGKASSRVSNLGYSGRFMDFLVGVNLKKYKDHLLSETGEPIESDPLQVDVGVGHRIPMGSGRMTVGLSVARERALFQKGSIYESTGKRNRWSCQGLFDREQTLTLAVAALGSTGHLDPFGYEGDMKEHQGAVRGLYKPTGSPWTFAAEGNLSRETAHLYSMPSGALWEKYILKNYEATAGLSWRSGNGPLLALETRWAQMTFDQLAAERQTHVRRRAVAAVEQQLTSRVQGRLSYALERVRYAGFSSEGLDRSHTYGAGVGVRIKDGLLDFVYTYNDSKVGNSGMEDTSRGHSGDIVFTWRWSASK